VRDYWCTRHEHGRKPANAARQTSFSLVQTPGKADISGPASQSICKLTLGTDMTKLGGMHNLRRLAGRAELLSQIFVPSPQKGLGLDAAKPHQPASSHLILSSSSTTRSGRVLGKKTENAVLLRWLSCLKFRLAWRAVEAGDWWMIQWGLYCRFQLPCSSPIVNGLPLTHVFVVAIASMFWLTLPCRPDAVVLPSIAVVGIGERAISESMR